MTIAGDFQERVDSYLEKLRKGLAGVSREDAREIVDELRSHILEKAAPGGDNTPAAVEAALAALGSPEGLAAQYMADDLLSRATKNRSPVLFLRGLLRWASLSFAGVWVLLGGLLGYFLGASFVLCAILKTMHPHTVGLWVLPGETDAYSLRLGFGNAPAGAREVLGWWIVPLGLLVGGGLCLLTTQFALWCARQYRKSHALRRG
jgi:hypothetical protein